MTTTNAPTRPSCYLAVAACWLLLVLATIQGGTTPIWPVREIWLGCAFAAVGLAVLYFVFPTRALFVLVTIATTMTPAIRAAGSLYHPARGVDRWQSSATWLLITILSFAVYKLENKQHQQRE